MKEIEVEVLKRRLDYSKEVQKKKDGVKERERERDIQIDKLCGVGVEKFERCNREQSRFSVGDPQLREI